MKAVQGANDLHRVRVIERREKIEVFRDPRRAVDVGGDAADDHVPDALVIQPLQQPDDVHHVRTRAFTHDTDKVEPPLKLGDAFRRRERQVVLQVREVHFATRVRPHHVHGHWSRGHVPSGAENGRATALPLLLRRSSIVSYPASPESTRKDPTVPQRRPASLKDLLSVAADAAYLAGAPHPGLLQRGGGGRDEVRRDAGDAGGPGGGARHPRAGEAVLPGPRRAREEHGETSGNPDYKWIIDPIDGTKSFIHGVPLYGVLIGVEVRGRPSVGVIYAPGTDELVAAADGLGCTWNGRTSRVSKVDRIEDATVLAGSITRAIARSDAYEKLASRAKLNRGWGDAYGYLLVATGRAEVMLDPVLNPWDCAPLPPILREAGGRFTTWAGEETIWGPDGVATNGALNAHVLSVLGSENRRADANMKGD
jgi:myo-inositol-1(or 4)-monophosphatase